MFDNVWVISIGILSGIIVIKSAYVEVFIPLFKYLGIEINTKQNKELKIVHEKLDKIDERLSKSEEEREENRHFNVLILEGVTASLSGLKEVGANGPVTTAIKRIDDFKTLKAVQ